MLLERKEVDYAGFEPELMLPAEVLAALRAEVNQLVIDLPVSSIWLRIWLPKAIRAAPITTATNDDVLDGVGTAGDLTGVNAIADGIHGNSPSFVSIRTVTETLFSVVPRRSATPNFSAGDNGIDCYMIHPRGTPVQSQTSRKGPMGTRLLRVISFAR